jgi:hypothetical protein
MPMNEAPPICCIRFAGCRNAGRKMPIMTTNAMSAIATPVSSAAFVPPARCAGAPGIGATPAAAEAASPDKATSTDAVGDTERSLGSDTCPRNG